LSNRMRYKNKNKCHIHSLIFNTFMVQYLIMNNTNQQFDHVIGICRAVFVKKMKDYGTAWRILRPQSMTDQIYIKAQRIRSIEEKGVAKMRISSYTDLILMKIKRTKQIEDNQGLTIASEGIDANYLDMINYAIFGLIKLEFE